MSFAKMKSLIDLQGGSVRNAKIKDGQRLERIQQKSDPSFREYFYLWEFGKDEDINIPIKVFHPKHSDAQGFALEFNCLIDVGLEIGDVLHDQEENKYWLVTESYNMDKIQRKGKLLWCKQWIRWQDDGGNIYDYPAFDINSTQYNSGTTESNTMRLGTTQHQFAITADENTIALMRDKRFFLDRNKIHPTVFMISQNDTTAYEYDKGILKITLAESEYNPDTDSIEHWICDYKEKVEPVIQPVEITYAGEAIIRIGGRKTFNTTVPVTFSLKYDTALDGKLTLDVVSDTQCKVSVASDQRIINETFKVVAVDGSGNKGEVEIEISGGV